MPSIFFAAGNEVSDGTDAFPSATEEGASGTDEGVGATIHAAADGISRGGDRREEGSRDNGSLARAGARDSCDDGLSTSSSFVEATGVVVATDAADDGGRFSFMRTWD